MVQFAKDNLNERFRKEAVAPTGAWRLLSFMVFVFLVLLLSYFGLVFGYKNFVLAQIEKKEQELAALAEQVPKAEQDEFLKFQYQIINLKNLLNNHTAATKILPFLEANTNTQVSYAGLDLNVTEARASMQGSAQSYEVLAEQLAAYGRAPEIVRYKMNSAKLGEGGRVQFDITLFFKPEVFK